MDLEIIENLSNQYARNETEFCRNGHSKHGKLRTFRTEVTNVIILYITKMFKVTINVVNHIKN